MAAVGGSIESITLDGRTFSVPADAEATRKIGGWENEVQSNGDGTGRLVKTRVPFVLDGISVSTDDTRGDAEYLQELQDRSDFFSLSVTFASGATYQGTGQIIGETSTSSQNATTTISLSGPGTMTKQ